MSTFRLPEHTVPAISWRDALVPGLLTLCLIFLSTVNYPWFHALAELATVTIGVSLFLIARTTFPLTLNAFLLCVATGFFWSSLLDVFHALTYEGMAQHAEYRADTPPLLWLSARTVQVLALMLAPLFLRRAALERWLFSGMGLLSAAALYLVLSGMLPVAYDPERGMTAFKILWEWVLIMSILWTAVTLTARRHLMPEGAFKIVLAILVLMALTELSFTLYEKPSSTMNLVGHIFKLWSYFLVFWMVSRYMLVQPKRVMKHQAQLLQNVLARVPGMAFQLHRQPNGDLHFALASTGVTEIFELTPEEVLHSAAAAFVRIVGKDLQAFLQALEVSSQQLTPWRCEWQAELPRQGLRWHVAESTAPQVLEDGSCFWIGHIHDVTEQKSLKEDLVQHRDHLARMVADQTRELRLAMLQVEEASKARNEFLSKMSHEIRTPLNGIIGMAQVGIRANLSKQARAYLEQILDSGEVLLSLVNDILDVAKIEAGKLKIERIPVNLHAVIQRAIRLTAHRAEVKQLRLEAELADDLPHGVLSDEIRLVQVLVNLLGNAIKFTEQGYVRLKIACSQQVGGQSWLLISVEDTGIGMSEEQIDRLFAPFEQAEDSTARQYGGTGLGLAICKQIVDLMHGTVHVASQLGQGSCFMVRLPYEEAILPAEPLVDEGAMVGRQQRLQGCRILAAEDDPVNQWVLQELLEQEGASVQVFEDGRRLLEAVQQGVPVDVVLTDVQMPEMDGYETTQRLKSLSATLPVIGLTAFALPEERERCLASGMQDHVTKPIDVELLVPSILRVLFNRTEEACAVAETEAEAVSESLAELEGRPPGLDWEGLLERLKTPRMIESMLKSFIQHHEKTPDQLAANIAANEVEAAGMLAHRLKGVAGLLVAQRTTELASQLEGHIAAKREIDAQLGAALIESVRDLIAAARAGVHHLSDES